jgi:ABC-type uncharacterized transport system ATPase subunit
MLMVIEECSELQKATCKMLRNGTTATAPSENFKEEIVDVIVMVTQAVMMAGMNADESMELVDFVQEIRSRFKITILMIEHHMDVVSNLCDYCTVLNFGKTLAVGTPAEVKSNPEVIRAYLGGTE